MVLLVVGLFAAVIMGAGEYAKYDDVVTVDVTTDDGDDSTYVSMTRRICATEGWTNSIQAMFVLGNAYPPYAGLGVKDSCFMQLYAGFADSLHILTAETLAAMPCTLYYCNATSLDTLLKENLTMLCSIFDTLGDFATDVTYPLDYYIIMK